MTFQDIIEQDTPVLVDFFATWCYPCKLQEEKLIDLKRKMGNKVRILKVDIDKNREFAKQHEVHTLPTLMIYKGGEVMWRESGQQELDKLEEEIKKYKQSEQIG